MIKKYLQIGIITILILFIIPNTVLVSAIGLTPAEMRVVDAIGSGVIGSIVLVNTESEPVNFILLIQSPSEVTSEQKYLRVICEECHDTYQRYEITNGTCPNCYSTNLVIYERIPNDILQYLSLKGVNCELIKKDNYYYTNEKFQQNEQCTVEILLNLPYKENFSNKHWEAHVTVTTTSDINNIGMGVLAGVQMRLLLDVPIIKTSALTTFGINTITFIYIIVIFMVIICLYFILKKVKLKKEDLKISKFNIKNSKKKPSSFYLKKESKQTFNSSKPKKGISDIEKAVDEILKYNENK